MEKMLSTYLSYVSIAGVIAAAGLLTLNATSHACETENAPRDIQLPIRGTPLRVWDFRYMRDFAGDTRRELEDAAFLFRLLIVIVVGTLISFFLIEGLFDLMEFLGEDSRVFSVEFCGRDRLHKFACD